VLGLGADVIAGFPGETDADHAETLELIERLPFTYLHVFPYSVRPGTAAERLTDRVSPIVAQRRAAELRRAGDRKAAAYVARRAGGVADVIVMGQSGGRERLGMTGDYLDVRLADQSMPRGARFDARLSRSGGSPVTLIAEPLVSLQGL
jgi:threonylcarbamoyladenosine tRNA methylthiotransferase MtaB